MSNVHYDIRNDVILEDVIVDGKAVNDRWPLRRSSPWLTIPVLIGASLLIYAMVYALPGDPVRASWSAPPAQPAVQQQIR